MLAIPELTALDAIFPTKALEILPKYADIPKEFKSDSNKWAKVASTWFFRGMRSSAKWKPKDGVDQDKALMVIQACLGDYGPSHEHKIAGVAFLLNEWFDDVTYDAGK